MFISENEGLENGVLKDCLEYLRLQGFFVWRNNVGCAKLGNRFIRFGLKGSSDILGILPNGQFLAVECKREKGGKLSEEQKEFLDKINKNNGFAICVNSVYDLEQKLYEYSKKQ
ncbi:VRR-NUC domain-containing protein [Treponema bryantii]|uniref:VRR-NUC domain-containing protein n=1 Tax=Treponema bryantii TaxID=163 RepID=A0A1H9B426_9SPIR|nr:VRR-NUC domain-containing protein [Treponema bryantii]SEP83694.1 VRR-NUC domain-containing protein [Treponema bryantii]